MSEIIFNTPKSYYFNEVVAFSEEIKENIKKSIMHDQYREYISKYRNIEKTTLEESYMFYILDGGEEVDEIIYSDYIKRVTGLQESDFVKNKERFMFPLLLPMGTIGGWVGYDYESPYKYLFSFSKFIEKGRMFFNMQNIGICYSRGVVIVVEGTFDNLRLNEISLKNNLGLMGKRMTEWHAKLLNRFDLVIFLGDNDDEGKKAVANWSKMIKTKTATVNIKKEKFNKRKMDENGEFYFEEEFIKDPDDMLRPETGKRDKFLRLYNEIVKESKSPFYRNKSYSI